MKEIWKDIKGFKGLYKVSNLGNVYSFKIEKKMKLHIPEKGYQTVNLFKNKKYKSFKVHRLVAQAFIPNPENKPQVNHIDHNRLNNVASNLEWCTAKENTTASILVGKNGQCGEDHPNAKASEKDVIRVCELLQEGMRSCDAADEVGISRGIVNKIRTNQAWLHISKDYDLKPKKRGLSKDTVIWIAKNIQLGLTPEQIVAKATNSRITIGVVKHIKQRSCYSYWTINFHW